jgi:hypothetical protein
MLLTQKSRSEAQIAASRANGAKSHGPVTPQGRLNSGKNKNKHGILARTVVLETECKGDFYELLNSFIATYKPVGPGESVLVQKMAVAHWRLMRIWCHQKAAYGLELRHQNAILAVEDKPTRDLVAFQTMSGPTTLDRVETTYDRQFARALRLLRWEQGVRTRTQHLLENMDQTIEPEPERSSYLA